MPYDESGNKILLSQLKDEQNALLNSVAYTELLDGWNDKDKLTGRPKTLYDVVSEADKDLAKKLKSAGLGDLVIKDYVDKNGDKGSGFCAIAFEDPYTGEVGMSFRGTEGMDDLLHNPEDMADNMLTASMGISSQSLEAIAFYEKNEHKKGMNYLFGHSKGGELAAEVYVANHNNIKEVHVINPQPINPFKLSPDQLVALKQNKFDAIVVNGDIVAWLGLTAYVVRYVQNNGSQDGFFGPHAVDSIKLDEKGNSIIESMPFSGYFWQGFASGAATIVIGGVQNLLRINSFVINVVVRIGNMLINDLPEMVTRFVEYMSHAFERFTQLTNEVREALREFVGNLVNSVSEWFKTTFNPGNRYASAHPVIKVDTYKLRDYAHRLDSVNKRLKNLDRRMDSLYWKVGLMDLLSLVHADLMTHKSLSLSLCSSYLKETAEDFETAERNIQNKL